MNATMIPTLPALDTLLPTRAAQATRHFESGAGSFADSLRDAHRDTPSPGAPTTAPQTSRTQAGASSAIEAARNTERNKAPSTDKTGEATATAETSAGTEQADRNEGVRDRAARSRGDRGRAEHRRNERSPTDKPTVGVEGDTAVSEGRVGERKKLSHKSGKTNEAADTPEAAQLPLQAQAQTPKPAEELTGLAAKATSPTPDTQAAEATVATTLLASPVAGSADAQDGTAIGIETSAVTPSPLSVSAATAGDNLSTRAARKGSTVATEAAAPGRGSMMPAAQDLAEDKAANDNSLAPSTSHEPREARAARGAPDERAALRENTAEERRESVPMPDKPLLIDAAPMREALAMPLSKLADQAAAISGMSGIAGIHGMSGGSALDISTQSVGTAAEHTLAAQPGSPDFTRALGAQVSMWASEGTREARLQLNPAELGPVLVHITLDGAQARVDFHAHAAATREAIEASLPALAGALSEQGLTLSGGGVFDRGSSARERDSAQSQSAQSHDARNADESDIQASAASRPATRVIERRGLVDLVA